MLCACLNHRFPTDGDCTATFVDRELVKLVQQEEWKQ